jgi:hypothetical protein
MTEERKGIGKILSESLDVISQNPVIVLPYIVPVIIVLIGAVAAAGAVLPGIMGGRFEADPRAMLSGLMAAAGIFFVFGILAFIFDIVATAFAINLTSNAVRERKVTLSEAWQQIGAKKIVLVLVAFIILGILMVLGVLTLCIGTVIVAVLFPFLGQGIVIDNLGLIDTFSNSFNIAKKNWADILILIIVFFVVAFILTRVPVIGGILIILIVMYATVAFTVLYLNRK